MKDILEMWFRSMLFIYQCSAPFITAYMFYRFFTGPSMDKLAYIINYRKKKS